MQIHFSAILRGFDPTGSSNIVQNQPTVLTVCPLAIRDIACNFWNFKDWNLFGTYLDYLRRVHGGLYHCAKFDCHQWSSFDDM